MPDPLPAFHYHELTDDQMKKVALALFKKEIRDQYTIEFLSPVAGTRKWIVKLIRRVSA